MNVVVPTIDSLNEDCTLVEMFNHNTKAENHDNGGAHDCCHHSCLQHVFVADLSHDQISLDFKEVTSQVFPKFESNGYSSYLSLSIKPPIFS